MTSVPHAIRLAVFVAFCAILPARANAGGQNNAAPAPVVRASDLGASPEPFHPSTHGPAAAPAHPPIDQVPPKPMPQNPDWSALRPASTGPGLAVTFDVASGQQALGPLGLGTASAAATALSGSLGYRGVDGGPEHPVGDVTPATMGGMTLLSAATRATFPYRMNVKLLMRWGASYFVCSGSMRDANVVLTAGHCVYDTDLDLFADEIWVYPAWDGVGGLFGPPSTVNPFGWAHSTAFTAVTGWTVSHDLNFDIGAVAMDRASGFLTGWFGAAAGGDCTFASTTMYGSASYPAEMCSATLHTGNDMYFWTGKFDSCPNTNRLGLLTPLHGCLGAVWGGMSGSGAYFSDTGGNLFTHAVTSTSNRFNYAEYTRQWQDWVNFLNGTFDPVSAQGANFNVQPLHVAGAVTATPGQSMTTLTHVLANTSTASRNASYTFSVYLSSTDDIDPSDTFLGSQFVAWDFTGVSAVTVVMSPVTIPANTPPGTYYLGVIYDNATDGNPADNDTDGWDALRITVVPNDAADVSVSALSGPANANPGTSFTVDNTVVNTGGTATGSFRLGLYLSSDNVCTTSDTLIGSRVLTLAAGGTSPATTLVSIPGGASLGAMFICAIADDLGVVAEVNENNNTRSTPIDVLSPVPIITLKVNGQHPTPPVVTTSGAYNLTMSIPPTTYSAALDAYWAFVINGSVVWVTSGGVSTTPAPLFHSPPPVLTDLPLVSATLPSGTNIVTAFFLVNGTTVIASDSITAQVP